MSELGFYVHEDLGITYFYGDQEITHAEYQSYREDRFWRRIARQERWSKLKLNDMLMREWKWGL